MTFSSPYPPYDPTDKLGFSYETVVKRWPVIITSVIDYLHRTCHSLTLEAQEFDASDQEKQLLYRKIKEGATIIEKISKLKYEIARDHVLEPIPGDGQPSVELYNDELSTLAENRKNTWFTAPWLYAECYLYRLLRSYFVQTQHWRSRDPFYEQKIRTFQQSGTSILSRI